MPSFFCSGNKKGRKSLFFEKHTEKERGRRREKKHRRGDLSAQKKKNRHTITHTPLHTNTPCLAERDRTGWTMASRRREEGGGLLPCCEWRCSCGGCSDADVLLLLLRRRVECVRFFDAKRETERLTTSAGTLSSLCLSLSLPGLLNVRYTNTRMLIYAARGSSTRSSARRTRR